MRIRRKHPLSGFKHAQEGILHCFRTQPHMRFHFYTLVAVLLSGLLLDLDNRDMLVLIFAITLVIVAEMMNTAVEAVIDLVVECYNPIAKVAKDVAAGAVLIAAANALIAGVLIFFGQKAPDRYSGADAAGYLPPDMSPASSWSALSRWQ